MLGVFGLGMIFFIIQEKRANEPIINLELWRDRSGLSLAIEDVFWGV
jgi:hypothetical protein